MSITKVSWKNKTSNVTHPSFSPWTKFYFVHGRSLDNVSALMFSFPLRWLILNMKGCNERLQKVKRLFLSFICCNHCIGWWSVWMVKHWPKRYTRKVCTAHKMARHSFSTVAYLLSLGRNLRLTYVRHQDLLDSRLLLCLFRMRRFEPQTASTNLGFAKLANYTIGLSTLQTPLNTDWSTKLSAVLLCASDPMRS